MRLSVSFFAVALVGCIISSTHSLSMEASSRRAFLSRTVATTAAVVAGSVSGAKSAEAAAEIFSTPKGVKYAILKKPKDKATPPQKGDIVAIEYTGFLTDGTAFDSTHAEGKKNVLMFELGGNAVPDGVNEMVMNMAVGQKVQAIIQPEMAFGDKGICLENGECLVKPNSTLVYNVYLKKDAIPPP